MRRLPALLWLLSAVSLAQPPVEDLLERRTLQALSGIARNLDGVMGVAAIDLTTGRTISLDGGVVFPQASSIKIPIMIQVFLDIRLGKLRMDQEIAISAKDVVDESPRFQAAAAGTGKITVRQLLDAMIVVSDNAATNALIGLVGMENVNRSLDSMKLKETRLRRKMIDLAAATRNDENVSTPLEMAELAAKLYRGEVIDKAASDAMLEILSRANAHIRKTVPAAVRVAAKFGELPGVHCETGVVFLDKRPFAISIASAYLAGVDANPVPEITRVIFHHFEMLAKSNRYGRGLQ